MKNACCFLLSVFMFYCLVQSCSRRAAEIVVSRPCDSGCLVIRFKPSAVNKPYSDLRFYTHQPCPDSTIRAFSEFLDFKVSDTAMGELLACIPSFPDVMDSTMIRQVKENSNFFSELEILFIPYSGKSKTVVLNNLGKNMKKYLISVKEALVKNNLADAIDYVRSFEAAIQ